MSAGRFREDLYFRLNVFPMLLLPLRDRKEDIPPIAAYLLKEISSEQGKESKGISEGGMERLVAHPWAGNVRELRNVIERLVILTVGRTVEEETVRRVLGTETVRSFATPSAPFDIGDFREATLAFEKEYLDRKLRENDFNISRTAERLGLDRTSIHRKMKQLGIPPEAGRR